MKNQNKVTALVLLLLSSTLFAQQAAGPAFEVASIKAAEMPTLQKIMAGQLHAGINIKGTLGDFGFVSLAELLPYAFRVKSYQVAGPDWMQDTRWDILAKIPDESLSDKAPEMMQALLAERFGMKVHHEQRENQIFELVADKGGIKFGDAGPEEPAPTAEKPAGTLPGSMFGSFGVGPSNMNVAPDGNGMVISGGPGGRMRVGRGADNGLQLSFARIGMPELATLLTPFVERPVFDGTGMSGVYKIDLDLPQEAMMSIMQNMARTAGMSDLIGMLAGGLGGARGGGGRGGPPMPMPGASLDPVGNPMIGALQKIGLRLQSKKAPIDTVVVDHLEKTPTAN